MAEETIEQVEVIEQPATNEPKTPIEEMLERVLLQLGKSRGEFDSEVEEVRQQSNPEMMANFIAMLMQNADFTALMVADLIQENADLKSRIEALEGGAA
ncbi:hypothetical protein [Neobacillus mesonae]|uniref:hypothetical protein n=1 Tax=Neobacillus mesonae TaxID=1193713 RepID=UPI00203C2F03|nr:hypothetical protein [Neobacillus mesonae]MCM3567837.1 hypothetical protein [Neobacillus mesonae]